MSVYLDGIEQTNYVPNVIILFAGEYFSIRQPDSGLVVDSKYNGTIQRIAFNPTSIDPQRPSTVINSNSFTLLDNNFEVSALFINQAGFRTGEEIRIWIGRSFENMAFSEYLEMPRTLLNKVQKVQNSYSFSTRDVKDRLDNGSFNIKSKLAVNILSATTSITVQDVSVFPATGFAKINDEFISWTGKSGSNLTGCIRGEFGSIPADHDSGSDIFNVSDISARNGIDFLLQLLISSGGGGTYDVLPEGAGINQTLVDITQFEEIRDEFFTSFNLDFRLYGIESLQKFIEDEIYNPMRIRLRTNNNGKIGLAVLDRNIFNLDAPIINEDNTTKDPSFNVSDDRVENRLRVFWNWDDGKNLFKDISEFEDSASITAYGAKKYTELRFKGVKSSTLITQFANIYLKRFSIPRPSIGVDTLNSASYLLVGDKTDLISSRLPTSDGDLNFESTLEVLNKSYDIVTGFVKYQLSFTAFSGIRQCFISPSDLILSFTSQKSVTIATGRVVHYRTGWKMRLFDESVGDYASPQVNEIASIVGDVVTFVDDWSTTLSPSVFRIQFADYNDVNLQQKRFCFISTGSSNFTDGKKPYQITFS